MSPLVPLSVAVALVLGQLLVQTLAEQACGRSI